MNDSKPASAVVVGIDGSQAAIHAAQWAIDEAISRSVPLRLVYVTKPKHPSADDYYADVHHGEASLRAAQAVVEAAGKSVKVETAMLDGPPGPALVEESRDADLICAGSVGIGRYARSILGSTATDLAEQGHCPVAIIRPQEEQPRRAIDWVVVEVNEKPDNEAVVEAAIQEAKLRQAPVLALGKDHSLEGTVDTWKRRHPDVHIYPVSDEADVVHFLKKHDERVQLAVIGGSQSGELAQIVGPYGHHPVFHHTESSVLIVRH
jgi:nucleotide-binding universal stress UspA family protein